MAARTVSIRSTPLGGVSADSAWRARPTRAPENPRSRARAENGVTLATSTER